MALLQELDTGTPIRAGAATVTLTIDGRKVSVPPGTSVMAAAALIDNSDPEALRDRQPRGVRLLPALPRRDRGPQGDARLLHDAGRSRAWSCIPRRRGSSKLRRGVMELYISDHPLDCLTCSANGDCELQTQAGDVGLRDVRYGYDGANHLTSADRRVQSLFHLRIVEVHRLLALRARLRGGAGHLRADDPRPRLRLESLARRRRLPLVRMRLLRRLRAGLPDRDAQREDGHRQWERPSARSSPPAPIAASAAPSRRS